MDALLLTLFGGWGRPQAERGEAYAKLFGWKAILATMLGIGLTWIYCPRIEMPPFAVARPARAFIGGFAGFLTPACICILCALVARTKSKAMVVIVALTGATLLLMSCLVFFKSNAPTGTWSIVTATRNGKLDDSQHLSQFTFANGTLTIEQSAKPDDGAATVIEYNFRVTMRRELDWESTNLGLVYKGLYVIHGEFLGICVADPGNAPEIPRPKRISSSQGDGAWYYLLKRVEE